MEVWQAIVSMIVQVMTGIQYPIHSPEARHTALRYELLPLEVLVLRLL